MRHLEDFTVGEFFALGSATLSGSEIAEFRTSYVRSADAGVLSACEQEAANDLHVCATFMRLLVETVLIHAAGRGGLAVDDMHWPTSAHAGDVLTGSATVIEARPSRSNLGAGVLGLQCQLLRIRDAREVWRGKAWSLIALSAQ